MASDVLSAIVLKIKIILIIHHLVIRVRFLNTRTYVTVIRSYLKTNLIKIIALIMKNEKIREKQVMICNKLVDKVFHYFKMLPSLLTLEIVEYAF